MPVTGDEVTLNKYSNRDGWITQPTCGNDLNKPNNPAQQAQQTTLIQRKSNASNASNANHTNKLINP